MPDVLAERARQRPDLLAHTFIDYEVDPAGNSETLTWAQVHRRVQVIAAELASCGSPGDRVAIVAPQGLEYVIGFYAAMEGDFVAVPSLVPQFGAATGKNPNSRSGPSADSSSIHRPAPRWGPGFAPGAWASSTRASCSSSAASRIC